MKSIIKHRSALLTKTLQLSLLFLITSPLTGCILLAAGAGAAGGVYTEQNYNVKVTKKKSASTDKKASKEKNGTSKTDSKK